MVLFSAPPGADLSHSGLTMSMPLPTGEADGWAYRLLVVAFVLLFGAIMLTPIALIVLL